MEDNLSKLNDDTMDSIHKPEEKNKRNDVLRMIDEIGCFVCLTREFLQKIQLFSLISNAKSHFSSTYAHKWSEIRWLFFFLDQFQCLRLIFDKICTSTCELFTFFSVQLKWQNDWHWKSTKFVQRTNFKIKSPMCRTTWSFASSRCCRSAYLNWPWKRNRKVNFFEFERSIFFLLCKSINSSRFRKIQWSSAEFIHCPFSIGSLKHFFIIFKPFKCVRSVWINSLIVVCNFHSRDW